VQPHSAAANPVVAKSPSRASARKELSFTESAVVLPFPAPDIEVPHYLTSHYWWAYIHPTAVRLFERQWLVNLILWGNYACLRDAALADMAGSLAGRTLQVACVYGDLTTRLNASIASRGGQLDVIDVLPIQLRNLRAKLPKDTSTRLVTMDSTDLQLADASYDQAIAFFLLHEQPSHYRERTLSELCRVVKPGGRIVVVDFALPHWWHPLRYLWRPLLARLEPFALDLWRQELTRWLPHGSRTRLQKVTFFGGLYQKVVIET